MDQRPGELGSRSPFAAQEAVYEEDSVVDKVPGSAGDEETPEIVETRVRIEQTRLELGETIDAITERLAPQHLAQQAKDAVHEAVQERVDAAKGTIRDATIGKVEGAVSAVTEKVTGAASSAGDMASAPMQAASGTGQSMLDTVKQHPVPAALTVIGATWLYLSSRSGGGGRQGGTYSPGYSYGGQTAQPEATNGGTGGIGRALSVVPDTAGQMATKAGDSVGQVGTKVQNTAQQASGSVQRLLQENPLAVGVAVAGLGMLAGLAVPETEQEDRLMGPAHDAVMQKATQAAMDTAQKVQSVAQEAVGAAKQAAQDQDLLPGS